MSPILIIIFSLVFLIILSAILAFASYRLVNQIRIRNSLKNSFSIPNILITLGFTSLCTFVSLFTYQNKKVLIDWQNFMPNLLISFVFCLFSYIAYSIFLSFKNAKTFSQGEHWEVYRKKLLESETIDIINTAPIEGFFTPIGLRYLTEQLVLKPKNVTINRLFVLPDKKVNIKNSNIHNIGSVNNWSEYDQMLHNLISLCYKQGVNLYFTTEYEFKKRFTKNFLFDRQEWDILCINNQFYVPSVDNNHTMLFEKKEKTSDFETKFNEVKTVFFKKKYATVLDGYSESFGKLFNNCKCTYCFQKDCDKMPTPSITI